MRCIRQRRGMGRASANMAERCSTLGYGTQVGLWANCYLLCTAKCDKGKTPVTTYGLRGLREADSGSGNRACSQAAVQIRGTMVGHRDF